MTIAQTAATPSASSDMIRSMQRDTQAWVKEALGEEILMNVRERLFRFLEEAVEFVTAGGMTPDDIFRIVLYVKNKELGRNQNVSAEAGDAMFTLMAACVPLKIDLQDQIGATIQSAWDRIPQIRGKHQAKVAHGGITG